MDIYWPLLLFSFNGKIMLNSNIGVKSFLGS
jgi:hypothetical protein